MLPEKQMGLHRQEITVLGFGQLWASATLICTILTSSYKPGKTLSCSLPGWWGCVGCEEQRKEAVTLSAALWPRRARWS